MNKNSLVDELLELIYSLSNLNYMSDLHSGSYNEETRGAILKIASERFSPEIWQATASYILGSPQPFFDTAAEAQNHLTDALKAPVTQK